MYQYHRLYLRHFVLVFLLTVGQIIPCYGGGVYLYEVNATEVGLAGSGGSNACYFSEYTDHLVAQPGPLYATDGRAR
jgi:hypothetical protein